MKRIENFEEIEQKLEQVTSDLQLIGKSIMNFCNQSNVYFNLKNYKEKLSSLEHKSGIYIFYIKQEKPNWASDFIEKWGGRVPKDFESRSLLFEKHEIDWATLYLGTSQDTFRQVMDLIEKPDSSLRLLKRAKTNRKNKKQSFFEDEFHVRIIDFEPKYYHWTASFIEKFLRMAIHPIIGKKQPYVSYIK